MQVSTEHQLETSRCILRYPLLSDSPRLLSAFQSDDFPRYVPLGQIDRIGQVREWIEGAQTRWSKGQGYTWTAERKTDGTVIGQVSLFQTDKEDTWSLAFWIHPDCWGQGYGTEIADCAIGFAFRELSAARVWAAAAKWNLASLQVLRKLGMTYLGDNQDGYRINDEPIPTSEFAIELSDWAGLNGFDQE
jgi:RimJ/RimL family protein N-acetyltransferase